MHKNFRRFALVCALLAPLVLHAGCAPREDARRDVDDMVNRSDDYLERVRPTSEPVQALVEEDTPWFGDKSISAQSGDFLPSELEQENALVLTFEQALTLEQLANRIQAAANVRVIVESGGTPQGANAQQNGMTGGATFLPADGLEVTGGRTIWQGKLSSLLDQIADRFDAEWTYRNGTINISQQITRTFMLHALAGSTDVGGSVKTGTTGAEGGLPQQTVDSTSKLALWDEIQKTIDTIVVGKARAAYSPATGTITVTGYPKTVKQVEDYLKLQNKMRLRRVAMEVRVLSVKLNRDYDNSLDVDVIVDNAFNNQAIRFNSLGLTNSTSTITSGLLSTAPGGVTRSTTAIAIDSLSAIASKIAVEYSGSLVTLSDQPAPLQVATKQSYVARVSGAVASDTATATTLEPGTIDIGLSMNILPRVIDQNRVMLRIALGLTDLVDLDEFTSGNSTVQLPIVDTTGFLQNAVLQSGETLVLAGFEKKNANDTQRGVGTPGNWLLGGGERYGQGREIRILLITANVLPEEPVNVIRP